MDEGQHDIRVISAVTLVTTGMAASVDFYERLGFPVLSGGAASDFTTFRVGHGYLNVQRDDDWVPTEAVWGRIVFHVADVDRVYDRAVAAGLTPATQPADAPWGERFFHIRDPDGHEVSFARPLAG